MPRFTFGKLIRGSKQQGIIETSEHSRFYAAQGAVQLEATSSPVLQQFNPVVEFDQADPILRCQPAGKTFSGAAKVVKHSRY